MALIIEELTYKFGQKSLIEKITHAFQPGIVYGILGPNGSGKSTLLKNISGIWTPTEGQRHWNGKDLRIFSRKDLSKTISLVAQHAPLSFDFNVFDMVSMGRYAHSPHTSKSIDVIERALKETHLWDLRHAPMTQISGGECGRVAIARALATEAPVLLFDEPTAHLDLRHQIEIWNLMQRLAKEGKLIIVAVHDLGAAKRYCDQLLVLNKGKCVAAGSFTEVITPTLMQEVFGIDSQLHHFI